MDSNTFSAFVVLLAYLTGGCNDVCIACREMLMPRE